MIFDDIGNGDVFVVRDGNFDSFYVKVSDDSFRELCRKWVYNIARNGIFRHEDMTGLCQRDFTLASREAFDKRVAMFRYNGDIEIEETLNEK